MVPAAAATRSTGTSRPHSSTRSPTATRGKPGDVDRQHVHGRPAGDDGRFTADRDRRAIRGAARIAVAIADCGNRDARWALRDPGTAVADALAGRDVLERDDTCFEGHHRPEPELGASAAGKGRDAVEHDAGPHPVRARLGPVDEAGGVRDAALAVTARGRAGECRQLGARLPNFAAFGVGQVRRERKGLRNEPASLEPRCRGGNRPAPRTRGGACRCRP